MKLTKWMGVLLLSVGVMVAGCSSEMPKAGTMESERIAKESKMGAELEEKIKTQMMALEEEMKNTEPPQTQEEFMALQREFQERARGIERQLLREFRVEVERASAEVAQSKKLGVVLWKENVVTGSVDITDEVIEKLGGKVEVPAADAEASEEEESEEAAKQ